MIFSTSGVQQKRLIKSEEYNSIWLIGFSKDLSFPSNNSNLYSWPHIIGPFINSKMVSNVFFSNQNRLIQGMQQTYLISGFGVVESNNVRFQLFCKQRLCYLVPKPFSKKLSLEISIAFCSRNYICLYTLKKILNGYRVFFGETVSGNEFLILWGTGSLTKGHF